MSCFGGAKTDSVDRLKLVLVGDGYAGKTSLYASFRFDRRLDQATWYVPTVFENGMVDIEVDGKAVELTVWDTAGQEDYDRLRPLSYPDTHVIVLCFAVNSPDSLVNITDKWLPELKFFCPGVPILLVGCKRDLRDDPEVLRAARLNEAPGPTKPEDGRIMGERIGAAAYLECSALTQCGVREVFETATRLALVNKKRRRSSCRVM